jgi:predicted DNA-binding transcriptional regulator AlpA
MISLRTNAGCAVAKVRPLKESVASFNAPKPADPARLPDMQPVLLSREDLRAMGIHASNPTLIKWEKDKTFPARIRLSPVKIALRRDEVLAHLDALALRRM